MQADLSGRVVLVTGASKGIGRAIVIGAAEAGADVVVNYCTDEAGASTVVDAITQMGRKSIAVQADLSRLADIHNMFQQIRDQFGRLDVLVNNAGVTVWTDLFETTEEQLGVLLSRCNERRQPKKWSDPPCFSRRISPVT